MSANESDHNPSENGEAISADEARLLEELRRGEPAAGHRFIRDYYPGVYRYVLSLAGHRETAEDLAQETFLRAWRYLDRFEPRAPLRHWLYRIARREFLRAVERQREEASLETVVEPASPNAGAWTEAIELQAMIGRLPVEEREVLLLHDLEGYTSAEIARIVGAPAGTVRYRLSRARARMQQEWGEGDLSYLNEPLAPMRQWHWLPLDRMRALEARLPLIDRTPKEEAMERREFLRQAAAGAAGLVLSEADKEIVDARLTKKVTLAFKGEALAEVCEHLRQETGVHLTAGASVADEKVTVFCKQTPLRQVMRQLSRPFGYAWVRSTREGVYHYELLQDLRSQLLEEELRSRDRHAALLALDREMERYRPYLNLSPEEAEARAKTAAPGEKPFLENLAYYGWGPIQIYFGLSASDRTPLQAGRTLVFSQDAGSSPLRFGEGRFHAATGPRRGSAGEKVLPPDVARGVLQGMRNWRVAREGEAFFLFASHWWDRNSPEAPPRIPEELQDVAPPAARPQVRVRLDLSIRESELGNIALYGAPGLFTTAAYPIQRHAPRGFDASGPEGPWATAMSPSVLRPDNRALNARRERDPALRDRVTVRPKPSCHLEPYPGPLSTSRGSHVVLHERGPRVTTADVLEALHQATGLPVVGDHYTRLYEPGAVSVREQPLFDALNRLADAMHCRWDRDKEGGWLRFRSTSFYDDRLKEVPKRLLVRWTAARKRQGMLTLDDLVEIAGLTNAQLDAASMAQGARACFGLVEWELARHPVLRPHLRYLAGFTPEQRAEAVSPAGLPFAKMPLAQQQGFLDHAMGPKEPPLTSLDELEGASLWIEYTQPGGFHWVPGYPGPWQTWLMPVQGGRAIRPPIRERTREAVLQRLARVDPKLRAAIWESRRRDDSGFRPPTSDTAEVYPSTLDLIFIYIPGASHRRPIRIFSAGLVSGQWTE